MIQDAIANKIREMGSEDLAIIGFVFSLVGGAILVLCLGLWTHHVREMHYIEAGYSKDGGEWVAPSQETP